MAGVFTVTVDLVFFIDSGMRMIVWHGLAVGGGIRMVLVTGMIRVVGVVCFRSGVITVVVGSAHEVPFAQPGRGRDDGRIDQDKTV
ncbi:hypothetical protein CFL01nite_23370 [Corynebacterium flavescens]|uniref:Uncharacterized protein n=1 Tax=Corynebacterium flavescens TaxID=28028 RepID=A0AB73BAM8_CORFL|nr:hypothetical protein CFL01nite_23370 [Corynebacterium flavescens]